MGGDDRVERTAAREHPVILTVRPDMALVDDIRRNEPVLFRVRLSGVEHVVVDRERAGMCGFFVGPWHGNPSDHNWPQHYTRSTRSDVSDVTLGQFLSYRS